MMNHPVSLPPGWVAAQDPASGQTYFCNPQTGESSWEVPRVLAPVPVPPPPPPPPPTLPPPAQSHRPQFVPQQQQQQPQQGGFQAVPQPQSQYQQQQPTQETFSKTTTEPAHVAALASNGLLVPAARALVEANKENAEDDESSEKEREKHFELYALSAGQIADLCHIQQQEIAAAASHDTDANGNANMALFEPYTALDPNRLPTTAKREPMESGRLDIRVHSLYEKLRKFQQ